MTISHHDRPLAAPVEGVWTATGKAGAAGVATNTQDISAGIGAVES